MSSEHQHHSNGDRDYADLDIRLKPIVKFTVGLTLFVILTFWVSKIGLQAWLRDRAAKDVPISEFAQDRVIPPEPRLQVNEQLTLQEQRGMEREQLESYGWVDQGAGVVRIPIQHAIDILAERGLPARETK
jgi:hypothetical protein